MSRSTDPGELVRLFFDHIRQSVDVQRALVLSRAGLSAPQYRLVHNVNCIDSSASVVTMDEVRQGGLLAELLYLGEFQNIPNFSPDTCDPAFDLLQGGRSLMALPLFEKGSSVGIVVVLGSSPQPHNPADLCVLATITSMLGRAIETQKLADQLEVARAALDSELKAAADVQRWLLPSLPKLDGIGIAASYRTARYSGGDYYDVGRLPDGRLGVLIADVSGKGEAAAVLMAVMRSIVHDEVDRTKTIGPAALLDYADSRLLALDLPERGRFITAFCGILDPVSGELVYSSAGHPAPRLLRVRDRTVISLDGANTFPLGLVDEPHTHTEETAVLMPGDLALFYSDGMTEALSFAGEFFGVERLDQILCNFPVPITSDAAVEGIANAVARFEGDGTPADDQTLVAVGGLAH
ncbi:MAG: SpoIIE family protein phosphatase [Planctomycetaceae bacterium]|nr:SpoIIE family protein phosphatase [Planctomycetaceae bacterium]